MRGGFRLARPTTLIPPASSRCPSRYVPRCGQQTHTPRQRREARSRRDCRRTETPNPEIGLTPVRYISYTVINIVVSRRRGELWEVELPLVRSSSRFSTCCCTWARRPTG